MSNTESVTPATRPARRSHKDIADSWMWTFLVLAGISALVAGISAAELFGTHHTYSGTEANATAGLVAAVAAAAAWLPAVALFDYLRRADA